MLSTATVAHAEDSSRIFHIPSQPLANALVTFSEQSGLKVNAPAELVRDKTAPAVEGKLPPLMALDQLLKVSGLTYSRSADGGLTVAQGPDEPQRAGSTLPVEKPAAVEVALQLEEVIVTAQKLEENIQEIPMSVTAVTGAALERKRAASVSDLTESVPNLYAMPSVGQSILEFGMRGTAQGNPAMGVNPTVGLYVDGAYIAKIWGANLDLEDLDRVEVLRGPQGTLYGRNTIGGAIDMITRKPTEERSITATTETGNFAAFNGRLTVNVPLIGQNGFFSSDALGTLSLRENAVYRSHDPYYGNVAPPNAPLPAASGTDGFSNLNRVTSLTALQWQPTKDITVDYSFEYHRYRQSSPAFQLSFIQPGGPVDGGPFDLQPYVRTNRVDAIGNNAVFSNDLRLHRLADDGNNRMHILTGTWDLGEVGWLGSVTVRSISAYRSLSTDSVIDGDGSPLHVFDANNSANLAHWSQEAQWIGTAPRVRYVLGAYYYGEHSTETVQSIFFEGASNLRDVNIGKNSSLAPFGQLTWTPPVLADKLSLTAGLRYTADHIHEHKHHECIVALQEIDGQLANVCAGGVADFQASVGKEFNGTDGLTPMGAVAFQWTDNLMTYVRVSRGFQSGTVNTDTDDIRLFTILKPEKLWAYEAGFKSQWFDNRLQVNADGFFSDYTDQVVAIPVFSTTGGQVIQNENVGASEIWGSEVELTALPLRGVEASVTYAFLAPKYTKWVAQKFIDGVPQFDQDGNPVQENVANQRKPPDSPRNTFTVGLTYTAPPTRVGVFSAYIDTHWQDNVNFHATGPFHDSASAYAVVNGRVQLVDIPLRKGGLDLAVFGRNLFDRKYRLNGFDLGALGWQGNSYGDPRTFGLGLTYHFTAS
jgi:iron complex outermembrane receptor protein